MIRNFEDMRLFPECSMCKMFYKIGKKYTKKGFCVNFEVDEDFGDIHQVTISLKPKRRMKNNE